jgi:hypothetical protein
MFHQHSRDKTTTHTACNLNTPLGGAQPAKHCKAKGWKKMTRFGVTQVWQCSNYLTCDYAEKARAWLSNSTWKLIWYHVSPWILSCMYNRSVLRQNLKRFRGGDRYVSRSININQRNKNIQTIQMNSEWLWVRLSWVEWAFFTLVLSDSKYSLRVT